jgi:flavin-dependent dehydrogenase
MLRHIEASGVGIGISTVEAVRRRGGGWEVECRAGDTSHSTSCQFLVLAIGRAGRAIRLAPRRRIDNLSLVAGTTTSSEPASDSLVVEATADGWWYSAPLVDGRMFAGWMTDLSLVGHGRYADAASQSLIDAPVHRQRLGLPRLSTVIPSAAWALSPSAGPGWIAIGDAALSRDPISGDGLTAALHSASEGADVVIRALNGDASAWSMAAGHADAIARRYEERRLDLYRVAAKRWPDSAFWRRFSATDAALAGRR